MSNYDKVAQRLALILSKLNSGDMVKVDELADEFGVSKRTIYRDLNERLSFLPLVEKGGFYYLEEYCLGKLGFNDIRGFAAISGVRELFPELKDEFIVEILNSKIDRTIAVLNDGFERVETKVFLELKRAIESFRIVVFWFKEKSRVVKPYKLVNRHGSWYLVAVEDGKLKSFSLGKIDDLKVLQDKFKKDENIEKEIDENFETWFSKDAVEVLLRVDKKIEYYIKRKKIFPSQEIIKEDEDYFIVRTFSSFEDELIAIVRYWIPHIKILSPQSLKEKLKNSLKIYET